jgi:HK97 gp10 family phage protein
MSRQGISFDTRDVVLALARLPAALRASAETAVLRGGAEPIAKAAKRKARQAKDSGLLSQSINARIKKIKGGSKIAFIGPRSIRKEVTRTNKKTGRKYKEIADPSKYSHLVEYGTSHSAAIPFLRPAIDEKESECIGNMADALDTHLTRVAARLARK